MSACTRTKILSQVPDIHPEFFHTSIPSNTNKPSATAIIAAGAANSICRLPTAAAVATKPA